MQSESLKAWSLISGVYDRVSLKDKLHVFIRQKAAPWEIFFMESYTSGNLLDYGCGHGVLLSMLSQIHPGLKLFGIDHDERKKEVLKQCLPEVQILEPGSLSAYPNYFDHIVICDMLYCNDKLVQSQILSDIRNILKPEGKLLIKETVSIPKIKYYLIQFHELVVMRMLKLTKGSKMNIPHPDYYIDLLAAAGFEILESKPVNKGYLHPHYMLVCKKSKKS